MKGLSARRSVVPISRYMIMAASAMVASCFAWGWNLPTSAPAKFIAVPDAFAVQTGGDMDSLLTTLNEALEENRAMRRKTTELEENIKQMTVEQNILKSQVRRLNKDRDEVAQEKQKRIDELEQELGEREKRFEALESEQKDQSRAAQGTHARITELENENQRLKELLDGAILESERDEYVRLIQTAQRENEEAVEKLSAAMRGSENMKAELNTLYYTLGKMFFEARDYTNSAGHFLKSLEINPNDSWAHFNLGILYDYYLSDNAKAAQHYRSYLGLEPLDNQANQIRERVLQLELEKAVAPKEPLAREFAIHNTRTFQYPPDLDR